jgi:hypothetical protein
MTDPIPAGFMTLPEALQRIAVHVSEAHLDAGRAEMLEKAQSFAAFRQNMGGDTEGSELSESKAAEAVTPKGPSDQAWRHWNTRNFAVTKLLLALQSDALAAMVRHHDSGALFRLTASDWCFEPFVDQIIRGGVIPLSASTRFEPHRQRNGSHRNRPF